jgi:hypothetical protein
MGHLNVSVESEAKRFTDCEHNFEMSFARPPAQRGPWNPGERKSDQEQRQSSRATVAADAR